MTNTIPKASFALLSGSAQWGLAFPDDLHEPGITVVERGLSFETPWGKTDNWQLIEAGAEIAHGGRPRRILNVFSHGWPVDAIDHAAHRKVAWVLKKAGVRKILADSTVGSFNKYLQPRDFVIARDVLDLSQTQYSLLEGRLQHLCSSKQLFCPSMAGVLERTAHALWPAPGRVLGHRYSVVAAHNWGPRFSSRAEAAAWRLLGGDVINQSIGPEASAAREIGACFISASFVVRYQDGILDEVPDGVDQIHRDLAHIASRISLSALVATPLSRNCGCAALHITRPPEYAINAQGDITARHSSADASTGHPAK